MSDVVENAVVHLDPLDNIAVCVKHLRSGQSVKIGDSVIALQADIQVGHKLCVTPVSVGGKVIKHGVSIGSATTEIKVGEHVHTHNMKSDYISSNIRSK